MKRFYFKKIRKGFTLIELLAVIVILAIILIIAVPIVIDVLGDARSKSFEITREMVGNTARTYVSTKGNISLSEGESTTVSLKEMQEEEFIGEVYHPENSTNECSGAVIITNVNGVYEYQTELWCDGTNVSTENIDLVYDVYEEDLNETIETMINNDSNLLPAENSSVVYNLEEDLSIPLEDPMDSENNTVVGETTINNGTNITGEGEEVVIDEEPYEIYVDLEVTNAEEEIVYNDGVVIEAEAGAEEPQEVVVDYSAEFNGIHNKPLVVTNMYPVKWNTSVSKWEVTLEDDENWYLYNGDIDNSGDSDKFDSEGLFQDEKWANVQISSVALNVGDYVEESDLNLYVWIPRYTYLLNEPGETIAIKYTQGITDDNTDSYLSMPGFTFGEDELTGLWVAKFEMSADNQGVVDLLGNPSEDTLAVSRPNVLSWKNISLNDIFLKARGIETDFSLSADSHLAKSSEWSVVAYLTEAIRDGEELWINNDGRYGISASSNNYYASTGCAGASTSISDNNANLFTCAAGYSYNESGVKASTTGNVYGVYDMKGGAVEYVATYLNDDGYGRLSSELYGKALVDSESKYKEVFDFLGASGITAYEDASLLTQGMAIHEISTSGSGASGWYSDASYFTDNYFPFMTRGMAFNSQAGAGIFAFHKLTGEAKPQGGWRAIISPTL